MTCHECGNPITVGDWPFCPHGPASNRLAAVHERERCVVWQHPGTGEVRYPMANNIPMPDRYQKQGFERREMPSLASMESFCREKGMINEIAHWDSGSGRGF